MSLGFWSCCCEKLLGIGGGGGGEFGDGVVHLARCACEVCYFGNQRALEEEEEEEEGV